MRSTYSSICFLQAIPLRLTNQINLVYTFLVWPNGFRQLEPTSARRQKQSDHLN